MTRFPMLLAAFAVTAVATAAPATPAPAPAPTTAQLAVEGVVRQMREHLSPARATGAAPTPEQLAAIDKVFGDRHPVRVERLPATGATRRERLTLPAGSHTDRDAGVAGSWSDGTLTLERSADGTRIDSTGGMAQLAWQAGAAANKFTVRNVTVNSRRERGPEDLWLGPTHFAADTIRIGAPGKPEVEFADARMNLVLTAREGRVDEQYELAARSATVAGSETFTDLRLATQFRNLDPAVVRRMQERGGGDRALLLEQWKQLALAGAELRIDDLSARYKGHLARLTGTVAMPGVVADDFNSVARTLRKLAVRVDVAVPLPLVRELAVAMAGKNAGKATPAELQDAVVNKAVTSGYGRIDGDQLRSKIEWRDGKLTVNDHPIDLPAPVKAMLVDIPPLDTSAPRRITMADRTPDDLLAYALNGYPPALAQLCRNEAARGTAGTDAAIKWCGKAAALGSEDVAGELARLYERTGDAVKAAQWRTSAAERSRAAALSRSSLPQGAAAKAEAGGVELLRVPAGQWDESAFRFDTTARRELVIDLSAPREHVGSLPVQAVCVAALAPSDRICLTLTRARGDEQLTVAKGVQGPADGPRKLAAVAGLQLAVGAPQRLRVFVRDDVVYFELNGQRLGAEPVSFPVETLWLGCASADCRFRFVDR